MSKSSMSDSNDQPAPPFTRNHFYIIVWVTARKRNEEKELEMDPNEKISIHAMVEQDMKNRFDQVIQKDNFHVLALDQACVYISRFGSKGQLKDDDKLRSDIIPMMGHLGITEYKLLLCTMDIIDEEKEKEKANHAQCQYSDSFVTDFRAPTYMPNASINSNRSAVVQPQNDEVSTDYHELDANARRDYLENRCRFALLWVEGEQRRDKAQKLMDTYHNHYIFDSETLTRVELFGYETNVSSALTHELQSSTSQWCRIFWIVIWKVLLYPVFCLFSCRHCTEKTDDHGNYENFQERLNRNPARIFKCYRDAWRGIKTDACLTCDHLGAGLATFCLWMLWVAGLGIGVLGVYLYGGRNDQEHPLTFMESFFQIVGYVCFSIFLATWIARRLNGVTGFEHELLYHNFEVYYCRTNDEDSPLGDFPALTALYRTPLRISLLQYMHQYKMLHNLKFHKSPFCDARAAMSPLPDPLTNKVSVCSRSMQIIRFVFIALLMCGFGAVSKTEIILGLKQYVGWERDYSYVGMGMAIFWFAVLLWFMETIFVRMTRYLNSIEQLGLLLSNKLTGFYLPLNQGTENIHAWCKMRNYIVRSGELVFSSIELHCLFVGIVAFLSTCATIWCFFFGRRITNTVFSDSTFVAWFYISILLGMTIARVLYFGYLFSKAEKRLIRRLIKHRTDFSEFILAHGNYVRIMSDLDMLIRKVENVSVVPRIFGRRVDGLLFPTLLISVVSAFPTLITHIYNVMGW